MGAAGVAIRTKSREEPRCGQDVCPVEMRAHMSPLTKDNGDSKGVKEAGRAGNEGVPKIHEVTSEEHDIAEEPRRIIFTEGIAGAVEVCDPLKIQPYAPPAALYNHVANQIRKPGMTFSLVHGDEKLDEFDLWWRLWPAGTTVIQCVFCERNVYLYHVRRTDTVGHDQYTDFVCAAATEDEARLLHPAAGPNRRPCVHNEWPSDIAKLRVKFIGWASRDQRQGVISKSYKAG